MGKVGEESGRVGIGGGGNWEWQRGEVVGRRWGLLVWEEWGRWGMGGEVGDAGEIGLEVWGRKGVGLGGGGASGRWGRGKVGNG